MADAGGGEGPHDDPGDAPRYRDPVEIGRGGMGSVLRALDSVLGREVAIKRMLPGASRAAGERFAGEARLTGQLDHPNIVPVHDLGLDAEGFRFYTMKLVTGRTLAQVILDLHRGELAPLELEQLIRILTRVADAIAFAHSRGVVHRDLKPANVMIGSFGQVYVMDWGIAMVRGGPPPPDFGDAGTISYMAPEQAQGRLADIDARTDVFALGGLLYEALTGWPPYSAESDEETRALARRGEIVPPEQAVPSLPLPPGLCEIAMRALSADPDRRQPSAEVFREELEDFLRGGGWFATRRFPAGAVIMREGEEGDAAYVVAAGECQVFQARSGLDQPLRRLRPGDVFGETAMVSARPRTATVQALTDVTLKVITAESFERELGGRSWVGALVRQLAERFLELERTSALPPAASSETR